MSAAIDLERLRRAKEQALSYAQARLSGASPPPPPVPMLPPYWGGEEASREWTVARQRRAIRQWLERNALFVVARREIAARRAAAFLAEGLA